MKSLTCLSLLLLHQVTQATLFKANNHFQQKAVSNTFIFDQDLWVANINDDGFDDLVITTNDNQGLMIYLGEREGKFKELFTTPVIGSVDISMVFDVDADGDSDIWLSLLNTDDERDVILINDGKGQFSKQNAISDETDTFNFSYDLLSGDLDNDGDLDVVKTFLGNEDPFNNTFVAEFFINDGAGNFLRHENQLSISRFSHLSDFNNDGYLDLITADYDLRVYYNDKSGFFQDTAHFHELNFPFGACENSSGENDSMLFEDIDNDGDIDIQLLSKALGLPRRINNGDGTFSDSGGQPCVPIEDPSNGAFRIDLRPIPTALFVDANQDGLKDLWVGYDDLSGPRVNFTDSNGFMTMDGIELEAEGVHYLAAGDFNQDNKADVVTLGSSGISSWIFESPVNYSKRDLQKINEQWGFVSSSAVEDFNGDGIVDLIFSKENGLYYRLGNGAGAFGESIKISSVGLYELQVLDFNSDGIKDAIGFDFNGEQPLLAIILRDHLDNHETKELPVPIDAFGLRQFEVSDIDGDGDKDLLLLLNVSIYVYQNQGEADFELIQRLDNNWYSAINFVDLNNQGRQAFIAYSVFDKLEPGIEEYHEWVWSGTLFELTRKARANRQESATVTMDFDGDGDLDILSTTRVDNEHHLLIVNETDVFTRSQYPYPGNAIEFAIDLNGDELVDYIDRGSSIFLNQGSNTFIAEPEPADLGNIDHLADLDGDGDLDVVATNLGLQTYLNQTNNLEMTGLWFNSEQDGHGLSLEQLMIGDNPSVLLSWFAVHENQPFWLLGLAHMSGNKTEIEVISTSGTGFGDAFNSEDIEQTPWGTVTLDQVNANTLEVSWLPIEEGFQAGQMQMQRLIEVKGAAAQPHVLNSCHSGSWYNANQDGHGLFVQVINQNGQDSMVVSWYHYFENKQFWMIGQGPIEGLEASIPLYSGENGLFPPNYNADDANIEFWGLLSFKLLSDSEGLITWNSERPGFADGELRLTKLTQLDRYHCRL